MADTPKPNPYMEELRAKHGDTISKAEAKAKADLEAEERKHKKAIDAFLSHPDIALHWKQRLLWKVKERGLHGWVQFTYDAQQDYPELDGLIPTEDRIAKKAIALLDEGKDLPASFTPKQHYRDTTKPDALPNSTQGERAITAFFVVLVGLAVLLILIVGLSNMP